MRTLLLLTCQPRGNDSPSSSSSQEPWTEASLQQGCWRESSIAHTKGKRNQCFTVSYAFHPLYKRKFILTDHRQNWEEERVFFHNDQGNLNSLPARWTSVFTPDPFIVLSEGKSYFHIQSLIDLAKLAEKIKEKKPDNTKYI